MDADFLEDWLTAERKSLIWVENTRKDVFREMGWRTSYPGALVRSQVRAWSPGQDLRTVSPG